MRARIPSPLYLEKMYDSSGTGKLIIIELIESNTIKNR